jgi:hypothetical protein
MKRILTDKNITASVIGYLNQQPADGTIQVEIKPYKKDRSLAQNRLLHKWITIIANDLGYTVKEMKNTFKVEFLGTDRYMVGTRVIIEPIHTSSLKVKEFTEFLRQIEQFAAENGIRLPFPDDQYYEALGVKHVK